ncbi:amino acid transporter [Cytophagales bacterium WSM2-2]|nr:amino acid transporter [Cytophagales bacterium WSM2-2]
MNSEEGLKREIGLWGLTANIVNVVIGSGIFVLPAIVSEKLGPAAILAYLFCGFLIIMIMLCFAEVGSKVTVTGGAYAYIEAAFGKYFGFLTTNIFVFGSSLMAASAVANALVNTFATFLPVFNDLLPKALFLVTIFTTLAIVNVIGVKRGITVVKITTISKLTPLLLLIVWGATKVVGENLGWNGMPEISDLGKVSLVLFFAFQGAEGSLSISGEVKDARTTVPHAILMSFGVILLFYISIQLVAQGVLGNSLSDFKSAPLAEVANRLFGPFGTTLMIAGAAISMAGYLSSDIMNMPRVLFRSSKDEVIPVKQLSTVHPRFSTPYISIILYALLCCFFSITGEFRQLAIFASSSALLIYLGVALATIKFRMRKENDKGTFKIKGGYTVPVIAIITILWFLSNLTLKEVKGLILFVAILSAIYFVLKFFKRTSITK